MHTFLAVCQNVHVLQGVNGLIIANRGSYNTEPHFIGAAVSTQITHCIYIQFSGHYARVKSDSSNSITISLVTGTVIFCISK